MMKNFALIPLVASLALAGCASDGTQSSTEGEHDRAVAGAVLGGIVGGVLANNTGKQSTGKTAAGVIAGAAVGGAIGHSMDKKEKELRQIAAERDATAAERDQKAMQVERLNDDLLRVSVSSEASFDFDKATLRPEFKPTLNKVAGVLRDDPNVSIRVVGHTDSVGSETYNQQLSERRARATADYLISQGVSASQVTTEGRGELEPRANNSTAEGRAQNRRVEIYLKQMS